MEFHSTIAPAYVKIKYKLYNLPYLDLIYARLAAIFPMAGNNLYNLYQLYTYKLYKLYKGGCRQVGTK